jgi:hypothetical protein
MNRDALWLTSPGSLQKWFRNRLSEEKHYTAEASTRRGSESFVRNVRWALFTYPTRATPLLLSNGIMFTEMVDSRIVGNPEVGISPSSETPREQWRRNLTVRVWVKSTHEAESDCSQTQFTGEVFGKS